MLKLKPVGTADEVWQVRPAANFAFVSKLGIWRCFMGVASNLAHFMSQKKVSFELVPHQYAEGSVNTANSAHISTHQLAKAVVFRDEDMYYTVAVLPASFKVKRHTLNQIFDRHLELAGEDELEVLFEDCAPGAIPIVGQAYGLRVIWDEALLDQEVVYMEAGDHIHLLKIKRDNFIKLMENHLHERFSCERQRAKTARLLRYIRSKGYDWSEAEPAYASH